MNWLALVGTVIQFIVKFFNAKLEQDKVTKEAKENALKAVSEGIKEGNRTKITLGFDSFHNARKG